MHRSGKKKKKKWKDLLSCLSKEPGNANLFALQRALTGFNISKKEIVVNSFLRK